MDRDELLRECYKFLRRWHAYWSDYDVVVALCRRIDAHLNAAPQPSTWKPEDDQNMPSAAPINEKAADWADRSAQVESVYDTEHEQRWPNAVTPPPDAGLSEERIREIADAKE